MTKARTHALWSLAVALSLAGAAAPAELTPSARAAPDDGGQAIVIKVPVAVKGVSPRVSSGKIGCSLLDKRSHSLLDANGTFRLSHGAFSGTVPVKMRVSERAAIAADRCSCRLFLPTSDPPSFDTLSPTVLEDAFQSKAGTPKKITTEKPIPASPVQAPPSDKGQKASPKKR